MDNPLDNALNDDFVKIVESSPLLLEAFNGLPDNERTAVLRAWNSLQWETILAAAAPDAPKEIPLQLDFIDDIEHHYGFVRLSRSLPNLHEYAISPCYNSATGEIVSYALAHRTRVFHPDLLKKVQDAEAKHADDKE